MVLCNCQLEATPSSRNGASIYTSDTMHHLPSWKTPCDDVGVLLERSMNVLRAQSTIVSTQPHLRFATFCKWRQLATHMHSLPLSCVLMSSLKRFRTGKGISPVRCGCCFPVVYGPVGKRVLFRTRNSSHRPARVVVRSAVRPVRLRMHALCGLELLEDDVCREHFQNALS